MRITDLMDELRVVLMQYGDLRIAVPSVDGPTHLQTIRVLDREAVTCVLLEDDGFPVDEPHPSDLNE